MTSSTAPVRPPPSVPPPLDRAPGVRTSVATGIGGLAVLLAALDLAGDVSRAGWVVGLGCAGVLGLLVVRGVGLAGRDHLLPADVVTLTRALLACGVAALTVEALPAPPPATLLVVTLPALALDAVDGRVARRTGTASRFGARFDGEADALLVLVLSVAAGPVVGWWVVAAGLARYLFGAAGWVLPWLRRPLPARHWRKVAAGSVGVCLTAVAADVLPRPVGALVAGVGLLLLAESFGRDVWWLRRTRPVDPDLPTGRRRGGRRAGRVAVCSAAAALAWFALLAPTRPDLVGPAAFVRLPLEGLVVAGLAVALRGRARLAVVVVVGAGLGVVALARALDLGMAEVRDRPFDPVDDVGALGSALSAVHDSSGAWAASGAVLGALFLVALALLGLPYALARLAHIASGHRREAGPALVTLALGWAVLAASGLQLAPGVPASAADVVPYLSAKADAVAGTLRDRARFDRELADDAFGAPGSADLAQLRGKDVVVVFVESYGRVAVDGPRADSLRRLLDHSTARLARSGITARSAFLTSPAFGSGSWLAHSTLQSGLRVDRQGRYNRLLDSHRTTLSSAFDREGWRTVAVLPSTHGAWPEGTAFYQFDRVYAAGDLGYAGPSFGFSTMPDQYTLAALQRLELDGTRRPPVMAEVVLTSSHWPWAPLPTTVDPAALDSGTVFDRVEARARTAADLWSDRDAVPGAYRTSIAYALTSVLDFVASSRDDELVVLLLGDHQPSTVVTGPGASHDVPVTLIARDRSVVDAAAGWGWQPGLRPDDAAPVQPMASLRDRFLSTFSGPAPG